MVFPASPPVIWASLFLPIQLQTHIHEQIKAYINSYKPLESLETINHIYSPCTAQSLFLKYILFAGQVGEVKIWC